MHFCLYIRALLRCGWCEAHPAGFAALGGGSGSGEAPCNVFVNSGPDLCRIQRFRELGRIVCRHIMCSRWSELVYMRLKRNFDGHVYTARSHIQQHIQIRCLPWALH